MDASDSRPRVRCPSCGSPVVWSGAAVWRPFCSERCRLLDLGAWFDEDRAIPGAGSATEAIDFADASLSDAARAGDENE